MCRLLLSSFFWKSPEDLTKMLKSELAVKCRHA